MKSGPVTRIVLVCVLVVIAGAAIVLLERVPVRRLASLAGISVTVSDNHGTPAPTPSPTPADQRLSELSRSTVAVQTFSGSTLVRSGSGVVASADGLILTTWAAAPFGSGSAVYQVATAHGAVLRAHRVASDPSGLVLLRVDTNELDAVSFDSSAPVRIGQEVWVVAAQMQISRYAPVLVPARAVYEDASGQVAYSLDRTFLPLLAGAQVLASDGSAIGIVRPGGGFSVIPATTISAFIGRYLSSVN